MANKLHFSNPIFSGYSLDSLNQSWDFICVDGIDQLLIVSFAKGGLIQMQIDNVREEVYL